MWVKVYSPNVKSIELVKRAEKRARRARLYYMRYVYFLPFRVLGYDLGVLGSWANGGTGNLSMTVVVLRVRWSSI